MHEHNECEHELKYCKKCDVVYCTKCKREWNDHVPNYKYSWYVSTTMPYWEKDWGIICDTNVSEANAPCAPTCKHG